MKLELLSARSMKGFNRERKRGIKIARERERDEASSARPMKRFSRERKRDEA